MTAPEENDNIHETFGSYQLSAQEDISCGKKVKSHSMSEAQNELNTLQEKHQGAAAVTRWDKSAKDRLEAMERAGLLIWNGHKLEIIKRVARVRGN